MWTGALVTPTESGVHGGVSSEMSWGEAEHGKTDGVELTGRVRLGGHVNGAADLLLTPQWKKIE